MYDASLDAFVAHSWNSSFNAFYTDYTTTRLSFHNQSEYLRNFVSNWGYDYRGEGRTYRHLIPDVAGMYAMEYLRRSRTRGFGGGGGGLGGGGFNEPAGMAFDSLAEEVKWRITPWRCRVQQPQHPWKRPLKTS